MADLPHKEHAVFIDAPRVMKRRNRAAAFLAVTAIPAGIQIPSPNITLTAYGPTITVTGAERQHQLLRAQRIEQVTLQPRKNFAAYYLAIGSAPAAGASIAVPTSPIALSVFSPSVIQATPVFAGQDLQSERDPEVWQPARRTYLYAYQSAGSNAVNVNPPNLTLTAFAPELLLTGVVFAPPVAVSLTAFAPDIQQQNSGRVVVGLLNLQLAPFPPTVTIEGPGLVNVDALSISLAAYPPVVQQYADIARMEINMVSDKITIRMRRA